MPEQVPDSGQSQTSGSTSSEASPAESEPGSPLLSHSKADLPYIVEPMRLDDLEQVMEIEKVAFSAPWSARSYRYEITQNKNGHLVVVRPAQRLEPAATQMAILAESGWTDPVLGYAGFWLLVDEAHIATIAVHPDWRGLGLGELLLIALLEEAA